jgi:hypothetical protein
MPYKGSAVLVGALLAGSCASAVARPAFTTFNANLRSGPGVGSAIVDIVPDQADRSPLLLRLVVSGGLGRGRGLPFFHSDCLWAATRDHREGDAGGDDSQCDASDRRL